MNQLTLGLGGISKSIDSDGNIRGWRLPVPYASESGHHYDKVRYANCYNGSTGERGSERSTNVPAGSSLGCMGSSNWCPEER